MISFCRRMVKWPSFFFFGAERFHVFLVRFVVAPLKLVIRQAFKLNHQSLVLLCALIRELDRAVFPTIPGIAHLWKLQIEDKFNLSRIWNADHLSHLERSATLVHNAQNSAARTPLWISPSNLHRAELGVYLGVSLRI